MTLSHVEARKHIIKALELAKLSTDLRVAQALQGVAWLESRYGSGWRGAGVNSWNMGAIQAGHPPCNPDKSFLYTDTKPQPDGSSIPYKICFRKYPSPAEGFADLARVVYSKRRASVLQAALEGDLYKVSKTMRETLYYEGFGPTQEARIANHHKALHLAVVRIARALGEKMPDGSDVPPRVLRLTNLNMKGADVERLQRALGIPVTGVYDRDVRKAVMALQASRQGVTVDGIVGHGQTWPIVYEIEKNRGPCE